jgi:hypothetical protein
LRGSSFNAISCLKKAEICIKMDKKINQFLHWTLKVHKT